MRIFQENEAIRLIAQSHGRFLPYVGAGVSAESGVKTAPAICDDIRVRLAAGLSEAEVKELLDTRLEWDNAATPLLQVHSKLWKPITSSSVFPA